MISLFRGGCIRAYVDIQLPETDDIQPLITAIEATANGMYQQHKSIILAPPENFGVNESTGGQWRFLRLHPYCDS